MKVYFISKDANWQKYRLDVLTKLGAAYDHKIEILTTGQLKEHLTDNSFVQYKRFKSLLSWKVNFMPGILWYVIRHKPDAVLALNNVSFFTEYLSFIICKIVGVKFIWWTHGYDHKKSPNSFFSILKEKYVLFFLRKGDAIITFSNQGREYLVSKKIKAEKIVTAANTLDTEQILETKANYSGKKTELRVKFGFKDTDKLLIFTGRLTKEKKIDHAIKALNLLKKEYSDNLKLIIIGDGTEFEPLKDLIKELKLENVFLKGEIYDEEILAQWFTISDLYIMPAYVGLGIIHAFCYELPIITEQDENHGPEIQYLESGENGYMVEKNDIDELSKKIKELISDEILLKQFSQKAFETLIKKGDINLMVKNMNTAITSIK